MDPSDSPHPLSGSDSASKAELRYRAVLRAILGKGQGLLMALRPDRARFLVGGQQGRVVSTLLDRSASEQELVAELSALSSDLGEKQSIVVISDRPWAAQVLKQLKEGAPAEFALFHVAPDGAVLSLASISFTDQRAELHAALKAQTGATLDATEPAARFFAAMDEALRTAAQQISDVQSFAQAHSARPVRVTYALLALYAVMFALTFAFGGKEEWGGVLWRLGAEVPERVREGDWWRLLSATVLHGGTVHILMNSLGLWVLGPFMERLLGWSRFLVLYVLAGLCGTLFATLLGPMLKIGLSVGASGSLFGLLGVSAVLAFRPAGLPALLVADLKKGAVQNLILNVLVSLQPHVDWTAHLGGALMGGLLVLTGIVRPILHARGGQPDASPDRGGWAWASVGVLAGLALLGCTAMAVIKGQAWLLRDPSSAARMPLGTTALSVEVPRVLGAPQLVPRPRGQTQIELGGIIADQVLIVRVLPLSPPLATPEELRQAWEAELPKLRDLKPPEGTSALGEPQVTEIAGYPTLESRFAFSSGERMRRMLQLRARYLVILELQTAPNLPAKRTIDQKRILESLREESAAPRAP